MIIDAPPRHGKSEYVSKYLPPWFLGMFPDRHVQLAGYQARFAASWGRKSRDLFEEWGPELFGVTARQDMRAADSWGIQDLDGRPRDGTMHTCGIGGPMTGRGAHLLIVDDPIKNAEEAMSETILDRHWDWWESTASTRLEPGGKAIVMATRWSERDLSGRLLESAERGDGPPVLRIHLPALAEGNDILGRQDGEPLWPERYPREKLEEIKSARSPYWWNCLYQGRPTRHDASEWPDDYFGEHIWVDEGYWPEAFEVSAVFLDPSKGKSKDSDFSALVFVGLCGGSLWVDADIRRRGTPAMVSEAVSFFQQHGPDVFGLESNAWQELLAPMFDKECEELGIPPLPIHLVENTVNKEVRIMRLGPLLARKKLRFRRTPGCRLMVKQLREFPLGDHDDGPDSLEGGWRTLKLVFGGGGGRAAEEDESGVEYGRT